MSFEAMKKAMIGAAGFIVMASTGVAYAGTPFTVTPAAGDGQIYEFSGTTKLAYGSLSATCTLTLDGYTTGSAGTITITNTDVTGSLFSPCSGVTISNLTVGDASNVTNVGGQVTFTGVDVSIAGLFTCNDGTVTADFHNDGSSPSYFTIAKQSFGDCSLETLTPLEIQPAHSYSTDIDIAP